jgi:hypothetical protein
MSALSYRHFLPPDHLAVEKMTIHWHLTFTVKATVKIDWLILDGVEQKKTVTY